MLSYWMDANWYSQLKRFLTCVFAKPHHESEFSVSWVMHIQSLQLDETSFSLSLALVSGSSPHFPILSPVSLPSLSSVLLSRPPITSPPLSLSSCLCWWLQKQRWAGGEHRGRRMNQKAGGCSLRRRRWGSVAFRDRGRPRRKEELLLFNVLILLFSTFATGVVFFYTETSQKWFLPFSWPLSASCTSAF